MRDFMLTTFGGSGSLLACRLVDILDLAGVVVPPNPGNVSAFGLLTVDVKNDYVQTHVTRHDALDLAIKGRDLKVTGMGIDRLAMLKYGIPDLRDFFEADLRWLRHYGFAALDIPSLAGGLSR